MLPPEIIHIDRAHFLEWYEPEGKRFAQQAQLESRLNARVNLVANAMQEAFVDICGDKDRDMATCPACGDCPYFGNGTGQARIVFQRMAMGYLAKRAVDTTAEPANSIDLRKVNASELQAFVLHWAMHEPMTVDDTFDLE